MELKCVKYEVLSTSQQHKVGVIRIDRPEAMNALNKQVLTDLKLIVQELSSKRELRAAILTGQGEKAFVAGADIKEMEGVSLAQARELSLTGQALLQKLSDLPFPVIAAMNGF